ncbi:hypothetical protein TVAG_277620 [Trichomonas vaginalis G3]|uniref:Uncharacterized protein n=1 Tax=Trichomonas vaginalis (strain ATCC PRA-98 / G3) TaxID=412133 RepID=A2FF23_TRIV3|nr:hypothetical protein TVAG_277620 [Trichomonas vaginalis G3]|eukprot:XP_001309411.1 hypothetical protein [Trichomonas vaginalis G3]
MVCRTLMIFQIHVIPKKVTLWVYRPSQGCKNHITLDLYTYRRESNNPIKEKADKDALKILEERMKHSEKRFDIQKKDIMALHDKILEMDNKIKDEDEETFRINDINSKIGDLGNMIHECDKKIEKNIKALQEKFDAFLESQHKEENKNIRQEELVKYDQRINKLKNLFDQMNEKFNDLKNKYDELEYEAHQEEETNCEVQARDEDTLMKLQDINEKIEQIEKENASFNEDLSNVLQRLGENEKLYESQNHDIIDVKKLLSKLNNDINEIEEADSKKHSNELTNAYGNSLKALEEKLNKYDISYNTQKEEINIINNRIQEIEDRCMSNLCMMHVKTNEFEKNLQEKFNDLNNKIQNNINNSENDIKVLKQKIESFEDNQNVNEFNNKLNEYQVIQDKLNNSFVELQEKVNYLTDATSMFFGCDNNQDESIIIKIHYDDDILEDKIISNENTLNILESKIKDIKNQMRNTENYKVANGAQNNQ